jgi:tetratricopeptide (TPR) repeat protein
MYLRRKTKWSMTRKRFQVNWFVVALLLILIAIGYYVDTVVVPTIPPPFIPTATATRSPESFVTEAQAMFAQGKLLQAIELYKEAIRSNPKDDSVYVYLAQAQVFAGQYKDAQANAESALLLNPNNAMAHAVLAWSLDFQGKYVESRDAITRSLELDPNNGIAHAYYAEILADSSFSEVGALDDLTRAAEESRVAITLSPNTIESNRARGYILEVTGNYEEAIQYYQAAIAINGNIPDLHMAMGRNYRFLGVYDKAIEEFTRSNSLNPPDPMPDLMISRTYATVGEYAKAAQFAESSVKDAPTDPTLRGNYGVMLNRKLDWGEAAVQLGLAVNGGQAADGQVIQPIPFATEGRVVEYFYTYAVVLARLNRCNEALPIAQMLLGRVPGDEIAVAKANEAITMCESNLSVTPSPTLPIPTETVAPTSAP